MPIRSNTKWGSRRLLNPYRPINWNWPGNQGLVGEWAVTPNASGYGGRFLYDLVRGAKVPHDGALTGFAAPYGWSAQSYPGGFGSIQLDGISAAIATTDAGLPTGNANRTLEVWFRVTSVPAGDRGLLTYGNVGTPAQGWTLFISGTSPNSGHGGVSNWTAATFTPTFICDGLWHHFLATTSGNTVSLYLDGSPAGSGTQSINTVLAGNLSIGQFGNGQGGNFPGWIAAASILNRSLSADEAMCRYEQSLRGYPDAYSWLSRTAWFLPKLTPVISQPSGIIIAPATSPVPTNPSSLLLVAG